MPILGEPCIITLHPKRKNGVHIRLALYEQAKQAIERVMPAHQELTIEELTQKAAKVLEEQQFDGMPAWYIMSVKLDLEARGVIRRLNTNEPQRLMWVGEAVPEPQA